MRDCLCIWTHAEIFVGGGGGEGQAPKRPLKVIKGPPPIEETTLRRKGWQKSSHMVKMTLMEKLMKRPPILRIKKKFQDG